MLNHVFKIVNFIRKVYWRIFNPVSIGVRLIVNWNNEILLVKTRYSKFWYFPGGAIKKKESPADAVKRELKEECGIEIDINQLKLEGVYFNFSEAKSDHIVLYSVTSDIKHTKSGLEIIQCKFFPLNSMPPDISPGTKRRVDEYKSRSFKNGVW